MAAQIPLNISIAPFPEGFQGDMDQTFQQATQLMEAFVEGSFLTGLILPPGSTLPTTDQGPIAMGGVWYFWNPATGQYEPQVVSQKPAKNFVKNSCYQVAQAITGGASVALPSGANKTFDLTLSRVTVSSVLAVVADTGPVAGADNDYIPSSIKYTVGPSLVATPAATDIFAHEHLIEGADLIMLQGETLSLSFSVWTNTPGTYSAYLMSGGRDASYVVNFTVSAASTWTRIKIPGIPALPTGTGTWSFGEGTTGLYIGIAMAVGSNFQTATLNAWQSGTKAGSASNINMLTVANNQLKITGVKLEASSAATYCAVPSFATDYEECIRYYFTTFNYQSVTAGIPIPGIAQSNNAWCIQSLFPRRMCKIPTVVPYSYSTNLAGNIHNNSAGTDFAVATLGASAKGVVASGANTSTKGDSYWAYITADARLS